MYPKIVIDRAALSANIRVIKRMLDAINIEIVGVTKVFCGDPQIAKLYIDAGIHTLADSRLSNLEKMRALPARRMLLRLPAFSEIDAVVSAVDISLVSHLETAARLSRSAVQQNKTHAIILMADLGDHREGIVEEREFHEIGRSIAALPNIELEGIGANFCCLRETPPLQVNMEKLLKLKETLENELAAPLHIVSGGNSSSLSLVMKKELPQFVNQLRIGEAFVLGRETAFGAAIPETRDDAFLLRVEIIENRKKPSAFASSPKGATPDSESTAIGLKMQQRAICAIGKQDIDIDQIVPVDDRIVILEASSDHLVLDISNCAEDYELGGLVSFKLTYDGVLRAMSSHDIKKRYV